MDRYAVIGNPVEHSKSPSIHTMFAEQTGDRLVYDKLLAPADGFEAVLREFLDNGGRGANVTVPFKQDAWATMDERSERADAAQAVNTIIRQPSGILFGDNTDGVGLVRDLRVNHSVHLAGRRILVLGAGGAVRGVIPALLAEIPATIVIANRTREKAVALSEHFAGGFDVVGLGFAELEGREFDIIVNGTSASLKGEAPAIPEAVVRGAVCYDMVYGDETTAFLRWARQKGATATADGLGMLVEQAAESFYLWRGKSPETAPVIAALRGG